MFHEVNDLNKLCGFLFVLMGLFFTSRPVFACSCKVQDFETAYQNSPQIYLAVVKKVHTMPSSKPQSLIKQRDVAVFEVVKKWKGGNQLVEVSYRLGYPGTCDRQSSFTEGESYYVFFSNHEDRQTVSMCSLIFRVDQVSSPYVKDLLGN